MNRIAIFNLAYGALGVGAAIYLGRYDAIALCLWVMACGVALALWRPVAYRLHARRRVARIVSGARIRARLRV